MLRILTLCKYSLFHYPDPIGCLNLFASILYIDFKVFILQFLSDLQFSQSLFDLLLLYEIAKQNKTPSLKFGHLKYKCFILIIMVNLVKPYTIYIMHLCFNLILFRYIFLVFLCYIYFLCHFLVFVLLVQLAIWLVQIASVVYT